MGQHTYIYVSPFKWIFWARELRQECTGRSLLEKMAKTTTGLEQKLAADKARRFYVTTNMFYPRQPAKFCRVPSALNKQWFCLTLLNFSPSWLGSRVRNDWNPAFMLCIRLLSLELAISRLILFSCSMWLLGETVLSLKRHSLKQLRYYNIFMHHDK